MIPRAKSAPRLGCPVDQESRRVAPQGPILLWNASSAGEDQEDQKKGGASQVIPRFLNMKRWLFHWLCRSKVPQSHTVIDTSIQNTCQKLSSALPSAMLLRECHGLAWSPLEQLPHDSNENDHWKQHHDIEYITTVITLCLCLKNCKNSRLFTNWPWCVDRLAAWSVGQGPWNDSFHLGLFPSDLPPGHGASQVRRLQCFKCNAFSVFSGLALKIVRDLDKGLRIQECHRPLWPEWNPWPRDWLKKCHAARSKSSLLYQARLPFLLLKPRKVSLHSTGVRRPKYKQRTCLTFGAIMVLEATCIQNSNETLGHQRAPRSKQEEVQFQKQRICFSQQQSCTVK